MKQILHPKIKALQLRSKPVNYFDIPESRLEELQTRAAKIKVGENQTAAYFCIWGIKDDKGTGWMKGAFANSINQRGPKSKAKQKILVLDYHDLRSPIGKPLEIVEDDFGAYTVFEWADPEAVPAAKKVRSLIDQEIQNGWSFGFDYIWDKGKMVYDEANETVWIKEAELYEISSLPFGSNRNTFTIRSKEDFEVQQLIFKEQIDAVLSDLPRLKQLEIKQLLTRQSSLAKIEPDNLETIKETLEKKTKPKESLYSRLNKQLT